VIRNTRGETFSSKPPSPFLDRESTRVIGYSLLNGMIGRKSEILERKHATGQESREKEGWGEDFRPKEGKRQRLSKMKILLHYSGLAQLALLF